jgi:xanthine dehydrogenase YagS FAD-binding subunit
MRDFAYAASENTANAITALAKPGTMAIAGGTELLNWMRLGIVDPERIVDIGAIKGLNQITSNVNQLSIGALATLNEVGLSGLVRKNASVLADACLKAASSQVRNRATLGGNVLQKTRCVYFRSEAPLPWPCNKRNPGSGCAARDGLNERHAILGWTEACVATHPADPAVALACLDATAEITGPRGTRMLPMKDFHLSQADAQVEAQKQQPKLPSSSHEAQLETRLASDEVIVAYHIPLRKDERSAYVKVRERESYEYALVSAAAALILNDGVIREARLALGSVAQKPWRLTHAERALAGRRPTREDVLPAIRESLTDAKPLSHNEYKVMMSANAAARAIVLAARQA